ncbi:unnamed protein product [Strongylus vulgaris]|uniref:Uncharacterized protein n=1 Tax=Strongylus vulgaris TaxID=40348 RepID=A0A3P7K1B7_STRVU|nr:unnamed protein product [Strongylus vulgaris]
MDGNNAEAYTTSEDRPSKHLSIYVSNNFDQALRMAMARDLPKGALKGRRTSFALDSSRRAMLRKMVA